MKCIATSLFKDTAHLTTYFKNTSAKLATSENLTENDILLLHGGSDISPCIYNEYPNKYTQALEYPSPRDIYEINLIYTAQKRNIPIFAICRGAQLICAMDGGSLVQHVTNHHKDHKIITKDKKIFVSNSMHHQMMIPGKHAQVLATTTKKISTKYLGEQEKEILNIEQEPEIVWFPRFKCLGVQGHPEWMPYQSEFVQYCLEQFNKLCVTRKV